MPKSVPLLSEVRRVHDRGIDDERLAGVEAADVETNLAVVHHEAEREVTEGTRVPEAAGT